jgi:hypothetical protein
LRGFYGLSVGITSSSPIRACGTGTRTLCQFCNNLLKKYAQISNAKIRCVISLTNVTNDVKVVRNRRIHGNLLSFRRSFLDGMLETTSGTEDVCDDDVREELDTFIFTAIHCNLRIEWELHLFCLSSFRDSSRFPLPLAGSCTVWRRIPCLK